MVQAWVVAFPQTMFGVGANLELPAMSPVLQRLALTQLILEGAPQSTPSAVTREAGAPVPNAPFYLDHHLRALMPIFSLPESAILFQLNGNCAFSCLVICMFHITTCSIRAYCISFISSQVGTLFLPN